MLALRIVVVLMAFAVHSACVDPDRVLRLLRPLARRSALTATLIARLVPLAAADYAAARRGGRPARPGRRARRARGALARRLVAGSLDRAVDVAATLELRGYALGPPRSARGARALAPRRRFLAVGLAIAAAGLVGRAAGVGSFDAYPVDRRWTRTPRRLVLAASIPLLGGVPVRRRRERRRTTRVSRAAGPDRVARLSLPGGVGRVPARRSTWRSSPAS